MSHFSSLDIKNLIALGWEERRARSRERSARASFYTKRWKKCESFMNNLEKTLGRPLSVKEYLKIKKSFDIDPHYPPRP